tara:strand:+ start:235 stop:480 length:246 start_codon:yes stop_codon:yes gene_type:complete
MYSARKIITKATDLNSVLNPLTSSLSPSAKSNGERFVSASDEAAIIKNSIGINKPRGNNLGLKVNRMNNIVLITISVKLTS